MVRALAACAAAALLLSAPAPAQEQQSDAMIIMDASGSMWGVVGAETKIAAARTAVRTLLEAWPAGRKLGLMAYGHRRKGDCADIETIAPVGAIDAAALAAAVDKLNPKGKTPISDSLRAAAAELKSTEAKATIILVSDGIETCSGDPCAVARELEAAGVDLTAHVVGFDITDPAARTQLQCIADVTGGIYRDAADSAGLGDALKETATAGGGAPTTPSGGGEEEDLTQNLRGIMRLSPDSDPLVGQSTAIGWNVYAIDNREITIAGDVGAVLSEQVEPQDVVVVIDYGNARAEKTVTVEPGKITRVDMSLDAGRVVSEAAQAGIPGSASQDWGQLSWQVFKADNLDEYVAYAFEPVPTFVLPAGDYVLSVTKDELAKATKAFTVAAGDELNVGLQLVAGTLKFNAPDAYVIQIMKNEESLASVEGPEGTKAMNPGDYVFKVSYREGDPIEKAFTIKEGETTEVTVTR